MHKKVFSALHHISKHRAFQIGITTGVFIAIVFESSYPGLATGASVTATLAWIWEK